MVGGSSGDGSGALHSRKNTHTVCIHSLHTNSHSYAQTLLSMFLTSVGEVAVALPLNAVGGHWAQERRVRGSGRLTCAAETGRLCTRGSGGPRLRRGGSLGGLRRGRCCQASGCGPERRSSSRGGSGARGGGGRESHGGGGNSCASCCSACCGGCGGSCGGGGGGGGSWSSCCGCSGANCTREMAIIISTWDFT